MRFQFSFWRLFAAIFFFALALELGYLSWQVAIDDGQFGILSALHGVLTIAAGAAGVGMFFRRSFDFLLIALTAVSTPESFLPTSLFLLIIFLLMMYGCLCWSSS